MLAFITVILRLNKQNSYSAVEMYFFFRGLHSVKFAVILSSCETETYIINIKEFIPYLKENNASLSKDLADVT
jgi:hypothetical protein